MFAPHTITCCQSSSKENNFTSIACVPVKLVSSLCTSRQATGTRGPSSTRDFSRPETSAFLFTLWCAGHRGATVVACDDKRVACDELLWLLADSPKLLTRSCDAQLITTDPTTPPPVDPTLPPPSIRPTACANCSIGVTLVLMIDRV